MCADVLMIEGEGLVIERPKKRTRFQLMAGWMVLLPVWEILPTSPREAHDPQLG